MKYRKLGRTGFDVSEIGHGLWGMSGWSGSENEQSLQALQRSVDLGCNFFDSAWEYGEGNSDGLLGQILSRNADKRLYAASKIPPLNLKWPPGPQDAYSQVFPAAHVFQYADMIRGKLGVDTIDLLQFHVWEDRWSDEPEFRETVEELKHKKIIQSFGLSLNRWQPENGIKAISTGLVDAVQVIHNIFDQAPEDKLFPACEALNVGVIARVPLDEGSLGGKMTAATKFPEDDWRAKYFGPDNLPKTLARVEKLKAALPPVASLPKIALRYILSQPAVSTIIVGMRKLEHVQQNIAVSDEAPLDSALIQQLKAHRWDRTPQRWSD